MKAVGRNYINLEISILMGTTVYQRHVVPLNCTRKIALIGDGQKVIFLLMVHPRNADKKSIKCEESLLKQITWVLLDYYVTEKPSFCFWVNQQSVGCKPWILINLSPWQYTFYIIDCVQNYMEVYFLWENTKISWGIILLVYLSAGLQK